MRLLIFQPLLALAMIPFTVMSPIDSSSAVEVPGHMNWTVVPAGPPFNPADHADVGCTMCNHHPHDPQHRRCCKIHELAGAEEQSGPPLADKTGNGAGADEAVAPASAEKMSEAPQGCIRGSWCFGCNDASHCFWCIWLLPSQTNQQPGCYPDPG